MQQKLNIIIFLFSIIISTGKLNAAAEHKEDTLNLLKRFSFHVNAIDWMLATPDVAVELDFTGTPRSHYSVLVDGKYNWNTRHSINPRIIYNIGAVRIEARKYWRTGGKWEGHRFKPFSSFPVTDKRHTPAEVGRDTTVSSIRWGMSMLRRNVMSGRTFRHPRTYRAYYIGMYAGYEKFTYGFGRNGRQGDSYNFGFSGGWSMPLYFLRQGHSLDLDLGIAVGAKMLAYDEFGYEEETGCYTYKATASRHFLPYPMVQDIRLGLVFRFRTIGKKVQGGAERYELWEDSVYFPRRLRRERKRHRNWELRDSMWQVREKLHDLEQFKRDSLKTDRLRSDSLDQVLKALNAEKRKMEALHNDSIEKERKKVAAEARNAEKEARKSRTQEEKALKEQKEEKKEQKSRTKERKKRKDKSVKDDVSPVTEKKEEEETAL